jgi:hypothetical protein
VNAFDLHWLFSVGSDGTLWFSSTREGGLGGRDLYFSRLVDGVYQTPQNAGPIPNTAGNVHMPASPGTEAICCPRRTGIVAMANLVTETLRRHGRTGRR